MYKLGRKAIKWDSRRLMLTKYLPDTLPTPPASCDWTKGTTYWGMCLNDSLGDCTIAGCVHALQIWTLNAGTEVTVPDAVVLSYYESWDGYVNGDPSTDQGGIEADVLTNWRKHGLDGHRLLAFADVSPSNLDLVQRAIFLFGGLYIGLSVPNSIMDDVPEVWDVRANDGGIAGGHCVYVAGYDEHGVSFISWGSVYSMTWSFWKRYVDEAHCLLSSEWMQSSGLSPSEFDLTQLQTDLAQIH